MRLIKGQSAKQRSAEAQQVLASAAMDIAGLGTLQLLPDGDQLRVNSGMRKLLGLETDEESLTLDEFVGRTSESGAAQLAAQLRSAAKGGAALSTTVCLRHVDALGGAIYLALRARLIQVPGLGPVLVGSCWDTSITHRLETALRKTSLNDPVTGLQSRWYFEQQLEREWRIGMREKADLALIFAHVDGFETYRDSLGADAADRLLARLGKLVSDHLSRGADFAARYADHRLAMVLPRTRVEGALHLAESVLQAFQEYVLADADAVAVSLSLGVGHLGASATALGHEVLMARTEAACYAARKNGGNRAETWQDHMPEAPWLDAEADSFRG